MAVGIQTGSGEVDLDLIFAAYTGGRTQAAATNILYGSPATDLNQRYENILYGTAADATDILTNSGPVDLNTFFCALSTDWEASLPSFSHEFTESPQPYPSGTLSMAVTLTGGPGGTYTYLWSYTTTGATTFTIVSGQGTDEIQWNATGQSGELGQITVTCQVTATNGAVTQAHTTLRFDVPGG